MSEGMWTTVQCGGCLKTLRTDLEVGDRRVYCRGCAKERGIRVGKQRRYQKSQKFSLSKGDKTYGGTYVHAFHQLFNGEK